MDDTQKTIEELKTEIASLKIRMRRVEGFIEVMPAPDDYLAIGESKAEEALLEEAKEIVSEYDRASASLLQRKLSIGYARATKLMDLLENEGVIGPRKNNEPQEVLIKALKK